MPRVLIFLFVALGLLGACATYPDFDGQISDSAKRAPFPSLVALDPLLIRSGANNLNAINFGAELSVRAAQLRVRAAKLRRSTVVDRRTRADMAAALRRHAR